jgi:hypothetical protein
MKVDKFVDSSAVGFFEYDRSRIESAIVFHVQESPDDFIPLRRGEALSFCEENGTLKVWPQKLPYQNMILSFLGGFLWLTSEESNGLYKIKIRTHLGRTEGLIFSVSLGFGNVPVEQNNGFGIYDPETKLDGQDIEFAGETIPFVELARSVMYVATTAVYKFLSFLSCTNTSTEEISPSVKIQKKRKAKGKRPLYSYHILKLERSSSMPASVGEKTEMAWTNRVHLCRGHIKRYTKASPLFGKLVGDFWCPPHVRGNKRHGMVMKDYGLDV